MLFALSKSHDSATTVEPYKSVRTSSMKKCNVKKITGMMHLTSNPFSEPKQSPNLGLSRVLGAELYVYCDEASGGSGMVPDAIARVGRRNGVDSGCLKPTEPCKPRVRSGGSLIPAVSGRASIE